MTELFIDTPEALRTLAERLRGSAWITLDTEFIREKTFYPQLCLLQVANADVVACVDPLALAGRLDPLLEVVYDPATIKVLHSAHQDLEIFYHLGGAVPTPVFDTQIAATLLGQGEQVGYAALAQELLGVTLDKSQSRTDWSRRPLSPEQLAYAADDVRHLREIYQRQRAELERLGRLAWLAADFAELTDASRYAPEPFEAWRRLKGAYKLKGIQLVALRALAAWRERRAMTADKPRRWVLGDEHLLDLARLMPETPSMLERIRGLEPGFVRRHADAVLSAIEAARLEPREAWPTLPPRLALRPEQDALADAMMAVVRLRGLQKGVGAAMIASRKDLERLIIGDLDAPLLHGWRAGIAGREVLALLRGELCLEVVGGELRTAPRE